MTSRALSVLEADKTDLYYSDAKNANVQNIFCLPNTRFTQEFSNKAAGTSVLTISPGNGIQCPVVVLGYTAQDISGCQIGGVGKFALARGWGYDAIDTVSWRVGGSSQYFMTGAQLLQRNLRQVRTKDQANSILSLGGNQVANGSDYTQPQLAYIPLSCLHTTGGGDGIDLPIPSDILSSQIQYTVQLKPSASFWVNNTQVALTSQAVPAAFTTAFFVVPQLEMNDKAQSLANKADFAEGRVSYSMKQSFDQQEVVINSLQATLTPQPITLTGLRSGMVTSVEMWLVDKRSTNLNKNLWVKPASVQMLYMGRIFADFRAGSSAIFNLIFGTKPSAVDQSRLALGAAGTSLTASDVLSEYVSLPLSQSCGRDHSDDVMAAGLEVTNGILNIQLGLPDATATGGAGSDSIYEAHFVYNYGQVALNFSRGTSEYIF